MSRRIRRNLSGCSTMAGVRPDRSPDVKEEEDRTSTKALRIRLARGAKKEASAVE